MKYTRFISVMVGLLLITNLFAAATKPVIVIKADKSQTVIGGLVKLVIEVKGAGIKYVSWGFCDTALANIQKISILKTASSAVGDSVFKHIIVFTSTKPGSITIDFPVMARCTDRDYALLTGRVTVNFKNEPLLTNINDINANVASRFSDLKYVLGGALLVIIIIIVFAARYSVDKKKKSGLNSPPEIRQAALEKLKLLEQQTANNQAVDMAFDILKDFLQQAFTTMQFTGTEGELLQSINSLPVEKNDKELIIGILKVSVNTRFAKPHDSALVAAYITKVKDFISGVSVPSPIKV